MRRVASEPIPAGCSAGALANVIGVTERVVTGRRQDGRLPKLADGRIDLHAVIRAGVTALAEAKKAGSPVSALDVSRARESRLRGDRLELLNQQLRAELVPAEEMEAVVGAAFDAARVKLLAVPAAYGPRLAAELDPQSARETLSKAINDALVDLADAEVVDAVKERARALARRAGGGDTAAEEAGASA